MAAPSASTSNAAQQSSDSLKTFELANGISATDAIYRYDAEEQRQINRAHPWRDNPHHFKKVRVSATALIKMVMHARSGGVYEIVRKIDGDTFIVMDAFPLPVVGTETRVNAGGEATEYMVQYQDASSKVGRLENVVGWYHSHPGYGCWLSGIDVMTQMTNQQFQDPFLAIVIDPNRTISAGRVDIGAFRTYPDGYTPPNAAASEYQSIPLSKIEDFGVHASRYYQLEIEHFKSSLDTKLLDLLWNKYWAMTLSQSPLVTNRAYTTSQISDLTDKLSRAEASVAARPSIQLLAPEVFAAKQSSSTSNGKTTATESSSSSTTKKEDAPLTKAVRDTTKLSCECNHGLINQLVKQAVFNSQAATSSLNIPASLLTT